MKAYQRVLLFLLIVLFLTALLSPWTVALWNLIIEANPGWQEYRYPFSRIFDRLFMILGITLFFLCRRLLRIGTPSQLGLQSLRQGYRDLCAGFSLALASVIALGVAMSLSQVFAPYFRLSFSVAWERSFNALMAAVTVGLLEEIFFRGIIFKGLMEDWKPGAAFVAANLFFSAIIASSHSNSLFFSCFVSESYLLRCNIRILLLDTKGSKNVINSQSF